jgi:hypothetical protein
MAGTRAVDLLGDPNFRKRLGRWVRRAVAARLPKGLARGLFHLPGGRKWARYRELFETSQMPLRLCPAPTPLIPGLLEGQPRAVAHCEKLLSDMPRESVRLGDAATLARDPGSLKGKRVALMAHWDPDGVLAPYVRRYIAHLQRLGFVVVLAAERSLDLGPQDALGMPEGITRRDGPGYDFTSWKAAFELLPELFLATELLLCNDSVFAPVGELAPLLAAMEGVSCDFWGLAESVQHKPHLPSYFLLLRRRAVNSPALREFFARVDTNPTARHAVGHELNFSLWLARHGLTPGAALPHAAHGCPESLAHHAWRPCLKAGLCFMKRNLLADNPLGQDLREAPEAMRALGYPLELIQEYFERRGIFTGLHFGLRGRGGASIGASIGTSVIMVLGADTDETALASTLEALAAQTATDWELVAVHEGEAPRALTQFAQQNSRVRALRLPQDSDLSSGLAALRFALAHARREAVTFLQPGEPGAVWPPEGLERSLAALGQGGGPGVILRAPGVAPGLQDLFPALLVEAPRLALSALLLKKELLHGLDWNIPAGVSPAWWILGQLCLDGPFMCLAEEGLQRTGAEEADDCASTLLAPEQTRSLGMALALRAGRRHNLPALLDLLRVALARRASTIWRPL